MECSNAAPLRIDDEHRHTIRNLDPEQHILVAGDNAIPFQGMFRHAIPAPENTNYARMNLVQSDERRQFSLSSKFTNKSAAIPLNTLPFVRGGKTKVELVATVSFRGPANSGAESMNDIPELCEIHGINDFNF